jgi:hypothetical protein
MAVGKIVKTLVKRGRKKVKRGRKPNKVKAEEANKNKKAAVFPQPAKEKIVYTKKEKKEIKKLMRSQERDKASEVGKTTGGGKRDSSGRLLSKHIPPSRKEMGDDAFARRIRQGIIGKTKEGEVKDIGKYADIPENIMDMLYSRFGRKLTLQEIKELIAMGVSPRKGGGKLPDLSGDGKITRKDVLIGRGVIKKKSGGQIGRPRGVGAALRGYGKGYK